MQNRIRLFVSIMITLALSACATDPTVPQELVAARSAVSDMKSESLAMRFESEVDKAEAELAMAEKLFANRQDTRDVKHRAYLASQYAALVEAQADNARLQDRIGMADQKRQALLLQSREANAARAAADAERARADAVASRQEAELAMRTAEEHITRANQASAEAAELSRELDALKAQQTERGLVLTLTDVLFDTGKSDLKPGAGRAMDKLATYLEQSESTSIVIEGHTDSRGDDALNRALSHQRAESVRRALLDRGVAADRISAEGKGEAFPVASNDTAAGRQQNRRVEIVIASN